VALLVSVAGSLLGTWVAGQFVSSPVVQSVGAVLGALVPVVLAEVLSSTTTPPVVALAIAVVAIALTYVSFTAAAYVTESSPTFPLPPGVPHPRGTVTDKDGELAIEVTPASLDCTADGCDEQVRIENAGTLPLRVDAIEVEGPDAASFDADPDGACAHSTLQEAGDACSFDVLFTPSGEGGIATATLVIHQNLPKVPTYVPLSGENGTNGNGNGNGGGTDDDPPEILDPRFVTAGSDSRVSRICVGDRVEIVAEAPDATDFTEFVAFFSWVTDATHNGQGGPVTMRHESGSTYRSAAIDILADGGYSFTVRASDAAGQSRTAKATVGMLPGTTCGSIGPFSISP